MLTALSTVLGLILIAPTVFWGSMAYAIMGGLLVASLLTLVFLGLPADAVRHLVQGISTPGDRLRAPRMTNFINTKIYYSLAC
jgi:hypothetical protein